MIDPISALPPPSPPAPAAPVAPVAAVAATPSSAQDGRSRDPVSLSVDRDASGVFVYTLTDSASGRILAVIPRSAVVSSARSSGVDIQA